MALNVRNTADLTKLNHYRDIAWCCKANLKINPSRPETKAGEPYSHSFRNKKMHQTSSSSKSSSATSYTIFLAIPILKEIYYTVLLNILNDHSLFEMVVQSTISPALPLTSINGFQNPDSHLDWILSTIETLISCCSITIKTSITL